MKSWQHFLIGVVSYADAVVSMRYSVIKGSGVMALMSLVFGGIAVVSAWKALRLAENKQ